MAELINRGSVFPNGTEDPWRAELVEEKMQVGENVRSVQKPGGPIKHLTRDSRLESRRPREGVKLDRRFTSPEVDVWDTVQWVDRSASIGDGAGSTVFEQT